MCFSLPKLFSILEQFKNNIMVKDIKTELVSIDDLDTTCSIINALDMCEALDFTTVNSFEKRCLSLMYIEYGECNFERKSDWMRFVNKLNSYDDTPLKRMIVGDKKSSDWGGAIISKEDIQYSEDGFRVDFKEPTPLVLEIVGDYYVVAYVNSLRGKTTWEWYHRRNGHEDLGNYAGICEVFIYDVEILS